MPGESQQQPVSLPDTSVMTTEALERAVRAERDWADGQIETLRERLRGMDRASELLSETVNRTPTDIQIASDHLTSIADERFLSVHNQFDTLAEVTGEKFTSVVQQLGMMESQRVEQKADTQKAVDAALAAQKEAVKEQTAASERAIAKSEASTAEQLKQLSTTFSTSISGLTTNLNDLKERVSRIESLKQGGRDSLTGLYAAAGFIATLLVIFGVVAAAGGFK